MLCQLFAELAPSAEDRHGHQHLGNAQRARDLEIAHAFNESQGEDFCRTGLEFAESASEDLAQFGDVAFGVVARDLDELHRGIQLPRADHVEGRVDGGAAEIAFVVFHRVGVGRPAKQAQKDSLQHVLGVGRVAGDAVRGGEDQAVVRPKRLLKFAGNGDRRFL